MKTKILFLLIGISLSFASCQKDELEDLQKSLDKTNTELGLDSPIKFTFSTKDANGQNFTRTGESPIKFTGEYFYIADESSGWYEIYIKKASDVAWTEGAWLAFEYNPTTKAVQYGALGLYIYGPDFDYFRPRFFSSDDFTTVSVQVNEFNFKTGFLDVALSASTTSESENNVVTGNAMSVTMSFKGNVPTYTYDNP